MLSALSKKIIAVTEKPWVFRWLIYLYPPYWGTGVKVGYVSDDFSKIRLDMPLHFYNRNMFGTHFGGSLYAMSDPFYCIMLTKLLGDDYIVWDQGADIHFVKPGRSKVTCELQLSLEEVERVRQEAESGEAVRPIYQVEVIDKNGVIVATIDKKLYVRKKS